MTPRPSRLLIIDDNEMNRDMLARRLRAKDFTVEVAAGAENLLDRIRENQVDLVLLDIEMPEISGIDALQTLRQFYSPIQLPVIMVTARSQSDDIVTALNLGANDYVTKPIDFCVTLARITTQLSHKFSEEALRESEERYALAVKGANDGIWDWDLLNGSIYYSPRWKEMLGYQDDEIADSPEEWLNRVHVTDREKLMAAIASHQSRETPCIESETRVLHKDGNFRWMLTRGAAIYDASATPTRMAGSQTDITSAKVADALTGLPNRVLFIDRLSRLIELTKRHKDYLFAVLFLDLDGFKMINDSLGHSCGDQLLVGVADRLEKCLRTSDTITRSEGLFTIARLGGDEFTILLDHLKQPADASLVAERMIKALATPFDIEGHEVFTSVSIGVALSSVGYQTAEDIIRDADTAMYRAKSTGKRRFVVFDAGMRASVIARMELETDLRRALQRHEFVNFYQPIISLTAGQIAGFEALSRWQHPTRGLLEPKYFIAVAEETGLIRELGLWNLEQACRQISAWNSQFASRLTMSVNLSVKQLVQVNLVERISQFLEEFNLTPDLLKLEITESTVMVDPPASVTMLSKIKALGVQLAIDDFGTGYSSLSYVHRFPVDSIKIDRSFTESMGETGGRSEIVEAILPLAEKLNLDVVAEGVETAEQVRLLRNLGCNFAQGYYFSKPVSASDAEALLKSSSRW
jgi:diguanylate cyclase (GGDEF)-like protein/PAS domain S-box-containing protein